MYVEWLICGYLSNFDFGSVYSHGTTTAANSGGQLNENGLRPCISLRSDVKVIGGGNGSSEAKAYELGI